ncbi:NosD domain-containing protein [Natrarchaeobius sp. A-rgal3]|uniref:NosD domain-containing protein n=1 Tax=Natrarchaeobius versutus TaxID=1679078 RepID=UPI00350EAE73
MSGRSRKLATLAILALVVIGGIAPFVADTESATPEPVPFDETVTVGLTLESERQLDEDVTLPEVQVFYSQYEYVVGYYGVETFRGEREQEGHDRQFGYPLTVYVTDYGSVDFDLDDDGYPVTDRSPAWTDADGAWYVVDSDARSPSGPTVVSFADREDAESFAAAHGGSVRSWDGVLAEPFERDDAATVRDHVGERQQNADATVEAATIHDERPVSVVVGEDVETVQAGIDEAPANTTVFVPDGTYEERLEIDRPITLAGDGAATIVGPENGSVVTVTAADVGIRSLEITGVGPMTAGAETVPGEEGGEWDDEFQTHYTGADAAISAHVADGISVANVTVETPSNGVILRESPDAVVRNVTVQGNDDWADGFAGVMAFRSPGVIEESTILDGRDSIYLYRSEGIAVRNNTIDGSLLGTHIMHNDGALIANNEFRNVENTGIYIMTGPERNAVVGNEVRDSDVGAYIGGSDSYVAENVFEANEVGLRMEASSTIYESNVFAGNGVGARDGAMLPTNRVVANDFVGNDAHATAGVGPLRIWTHDGIGNYWQGGTTPADGFPPDRAYTPTDTVDAQLHTTDGAATLARAPALDALAGLEASIPGMQTGSITDLSPACEPQNPDRLAQTEWADEARTCHGTSAIES